MADLSQAFSEAKSLPDDYLKKEIASPSGMMPPWLAASELSERHAVRSGKFTRKPSIAQQILQRANTMLPAPENNDWGIPADAKRDGMMPSQPSPGQSMGQPMGQSMPPPNMPRYAEGGLVKQEEAKAPAAVALPSQGDFASAYTAIRHATDHAPTGLQGFQAMGVVPQGQNIRTSDLGSVGYAMDTNQTLQSVKNRSDFFGGLEALRDADDSGMNSITPVMPTKTFFEETQRYSEGGIVRNLNPFIALTEGMQDSETAGSQSSESLMDRNGGRLPLNQPMPAQPLGMTRNLSSLQPLPPGTLQPVQGLGAFQRR